MKIDKKNPKHWLYLAISGIFILISIAGRYILGPNKNKKTIVLYGHKLNGNLKVFADYCRTNHPDLEMLFLTLDPNYYKQLKSENVKIPILLLTNFSDVMRVGRAQAIITDHGLHTLKFYLKFTNIPFIDVWHGLSYKGFTPQTFAFMKPYKEVWVSSPKMREIYINKFKFSPEQVFATGYARVDPLVNKQFSAEQILKKYQIPKGYSKIVLIAPTWKQDDKNRSIVPFNETEQNFFGQLNAAAKKTNSLIIFRAHLNSGHGVGGQSLSNIKFMPYADYPEVEEFLFIADVLVSDWSSIVFDFMPLNRPTIFLDVKPPFKDGFTLDASYRFGDIVKDLNQLTKAIELYASHPQEYTKKFAPNVKRAKEALYGKNLDGHAAERYYKCLKAIIE